MKGQIVIYRTSLAPGVANCTTVAGNGGAIWGIPVKERSTPPHSGHRGHRSKPNHADLYEYTP